MAPPVPHGASRHPARADGTRLAPGGLLCITAVGTLAGYVDVPGPALWRGCVAAAVGAGVAALLALRSDHLALCWTLVSSFFVIAVSTSSRTDWALARQAPLKERLLFVISTWMVGARLWVPPSLRQHHARLRPT
jgi:hypothetical protein